MGEHAQILSSHRDDERFRIINAPSKPKKEGVVEALSSSVIRRRASGQVVESTTPVAKVAKEDYAREIRARLNAPLTQGAQVSREEQMNRLKALFKE
ncbi:MAG: hypothetical protein UR53_C0002G0064 [Candidatus Magasanikbacteria bacterium GW2011_GWC2_34_16]|uniref:Uncharacterized protein n=2 Tax=Candidatus Magasanikiibacteriota TaxID=1752731 RepID=A0A0G0JUX8_9BACT|nr:MAG: hypothetical protein UR53_C0002G0064 [Candidatus Magasanikbacteria bacterium GW2011_GWC2_34_16]KKQ40709.1 MAG: hypothetical protein US58_C0013G0009 [Candidatus Magasanikbacteria bacterium GW2011_GWA2_37_8]